MYKQQKKREIAGKRGKKGEKGGRGQLWDRDKKMEEGRRRI